MPKEELALMYTEKLLSLEDIAEYFNCSKSTVERKMILFNFPRRDIHELRKHPNRKVPCSMCGKPKPSGKYPMCKACWAEKHGREHWPGGSLIPLGYVRKKRKFIVCKNCEGNIVAWNRSGYCTKCRKIPEIRKAIVYRFCTICEKSISYSNKSGLCLDHSNRQRSKKTIFKRDETLKIIDSILVDLNTEETTRTEVLIVFMNLLRRRFFFGYTGNNHNVLKGTGA